LQPSVHEQHIIFFHFRTAGGGAFWRPLVQKSGHIEGADEKGALCTNPTEGGGNGYSSAAVGAIKILKHVPELAIPLKEFVTGFKHNAEPTRNLLVNITYQEERQAEMKRPCD
jgi:hypothetical protein